MKARDGNDLTEAELERLADALRETEINVYRLCESMLGIKVGDEVFERLHGHSGLRRCVGCDIWFAMDAEFCLECEDT